MRVKPKAMLRAGVSALALAAWMGNASAQSVTTGGDVDPSPAQSPVWTVSGNLFVGNTDDGTLTVEAGGRVSNSNGAIGRFIGSTGAATVTGAGSNWTNSGRLDVGADGIGTLTVEEGGAVSNAVGSIGNANGSTGTATVTGDGSRWTNSGGLYVGNVGNGTLMVESGGVVGNTIGV